MERFVKRHSHSITGTIAGFDRLLFRGTLRSISYLEGLQIFLSIQGVLYKDFGQFAEKLSPQIKAQAESMAKRQNRPYQYIESSVVSKEDLAKQIMEQDQITEGLVCVLSCVEPCQSFSIRRDREARKVFVVPQRRKCLHLYFYYVDREFGLMHVRLQSWLPFTIQVCVNGREWLARQMNRAGIKYVKRDNCFTYIENNAEAQRLMDSLSERKWERFLNVLANRVNPIIKPAVGLKLRGYYWSVRQSEYATDVMFKDASGLAEVYMSLARHAIERFTSRDVLRFLGKRVGDGFKQEISSSMQKRVEGTSVKHWVDENSIKMYDKQGSVLRIETTINNSRRFKVRRTTERNGKVVMGSFPMRKGIVDLRARVQLSRSANGRYLGALAVVGETTPSHRLLDPVSQRLVKDGRAYRPLQPISPADSRVFELLLKGEHLIHGIRNRDLRTELHPGADMDPTTKRKSSARISRMLRLLRAHELIYKVPKTNYHRITKKGHQVMTTATKFRETDIAILAA